MVAQTNRVNDHFREAMHSMQQPAELVRDYPLPSMLLLFGMGLGVGVVVSQAICGSVAEMEPETSTTTNQIRRHVYDALATVLPPTVLKQIQSYTG